MISHIYPSVLQAVSGRGYVGYLDGCFQGYRAEAMQDLGYELRRIPILRGWMNSSGQDSSPIHSGLLLCLVGKTIGDMRRTRDETKRAMGSVRGTTSRRGSPGCRNRVCQ